MLDTAIETATRPTVTVFGESCLTAVPDSVALTIGIQQGAVNASQAVNAANLCAGHVMKALLERGVCQHDIQTTWIGVYPTPSQTLPSQAPQPGMHGWSGLGPAPRPSPEPGLEAQASQARPTNDAPIQVVASSLLNVTTGDVSRIGEWIDVAHAAGASFGIAQSVRVRDESAVRLKAMEAAIEDTRHRAAMLSDRMGRELGEALLVVEVAASSGAREFGLQANDSFTRLPYQVGDDRASGSSGEVQFRCRVQVTYELI